MIAHALAQLEPGIEPSVGSVGDSYDNTLAESIIGLYTTEVIRPDVRIYGLNYKDERADAVNRLDRNGNAFIKSGHDPKGEVARKFGVYGVPETFVIDRNGRIVHRHTGPISVR